MSTEHVVLRCDASSSPKWTYYSMPTSVVGGSDSLSGALAQYRSALASALDVKDAPDFTYYTEREAAADVWVRVAHDSHTVERQNSAELVSEMLARFDNLRDAVVSQPAAGGDSIVVVGRPSDLVGSVLEQMTAYDAVWIAILVRAVGEELTWALMPVAGRSADTVDVENDTRLDQLGMADDATLLDLHHALTTGGTGAPDGAQPRVLVQV